MMPVPDSVEPFVDLANTRQRTAAYGIPRDKRTRVLM